MLEAGIVVMQVLQKRSHTRLSRKERLRREVMQSRELEKIQSGAREVRHCIRCQGQGDLSVKSSPA